MTTTAPSRAPEGAHLIADGDNVLLFEGGPGQSGAYMADHSLVFRYDDHGDGRPDHRGSTRPR
jgi:hypothetical protein